MKVDTTTPCSTNQPKQANAKTDNATTSSGTTFRLAKTPAQTSDTNPRPSGQALSQRSQAKQNLQPKYHQD